MYNRVMAGVAQQGLDAFCISHGDSASWLCQKNSYFFPAVMLVLPDEVHVFTASRNIEAIREMYPEYHVHGGGQTQLLELCRQRSVRTLGIERATIKWDQYQALSSLAADIQLTPVADFIEDLRMIKTDGEIELLQRATDISDRAFALFLNKLKPGMTEIEARNIFQNLLMEQGADTLSFNVLLASGSRCFVPHATASQKVIEKGDMVLLDYGAKHRGYCSDTSRTVFIGKADEAQRRRYQLVLKAQVYAIDNIRPGMMACEADALARDVIVRQEPVGCYDYGLGHGIGLQNHEKPRMRPDSKLPLQAGMAVSVEPGIYIKGWGGIRIEDVIVIGRGPAGTNLNLTHAKKELIEL